MKNIQNYLDAVDRNTESVLQFVQLTSTDALRAAIRRAEEEEEQQRLERIKVSARWLETKRKSSETAIEAFKRIVSEMAAEYDANMEKFGLRPRKSSPVASFYTPKAMWKGHLKCIS